MKILLSVLGAAVVMLCAIISTPMASAQGRGPSLLHEYFLEPTSYDAFGITPEEVAEALTHGLTTTNQPAMGSGLQRLYDNVFLGVTDRGPNFTVGSARFFPLPQFTPTIVVFTAVNDQLALQGSMPIVGQSGAGVTGIPNSATEDSVPLLDPLIQIPYNPSGMDIEDIHTLPGGGYILVEEYSPSVVIADANGVVARRYTPATKTLPGADYPVRDILPGIFLSRRANRGFESIAVSPDGRTAYTMTQSPLGSTSVGSPYRDTRIIRVLRLDISDPLNLQVTGQFAIQMSPASEFPAGNAQRDLKIGSGAWVSPDVLLIMEINDVAGIGGVRLILVDLRNATNFHGQPVADTLEIEDVTKGPAALGIATGTSTVVYQQFETDPVRLLPSGKLEGLSILNPNVVAISNDNDFGVGEAAGLRSRMMVLRLGSQLPLAE